MNLWTTNLNTGQSDETTLDKLVDDIHLGPDEIVEIRDLSPGEITFLNGFSIQRPFEDGEGEE